MVATCHSAAPTILPGFITSFEQLLILACAKNRNYSLLSLLEKELKCSKKSNARMPIN